MSKNISRDELLQVAATILSGGVAGMNGGIVSISDVTVSSERIRQVVDLAEKLIEEIDSRYDNTTELKFESSFDRDTLVKDDEFIDETLNNS